MKMKTLILTQDDLEIIKLCVDLSDDMRYCMYHRLENDKNEKTQRLRKFLKNW